MWSAAPFDQHPIVCLSVVVYVVAFDFCMDGVVRDMIPMVMIGHRDLISTLIVVVKVFREKIIYKIVCRDINHVIVVIGMMKVIVGRLSFS
jgi:hypothetical protein